MRARLAMWGFATVVLSGHATAQSLPFLASTPSRAIVDSLETIELQFFRQWGEAWRLSEDARSDGVAERRDSTRARNLHLHCHPETLGPAPTMFAWIVRANSMIRSSAGWFAVCPTWLLGKSVGDEAVALDDALSPELRPQIRSARQSVIAALDRAARAFPSSDWIVGQRVRFLLDLQVADSALAVARSCAATPWWCASLVGYVLAKQKRFAEADSAFVSALGLLAPAERCRWIDFSDLMERAGRVQYERFTCAQRESMNERLWWLADPLFIVPGNERRAEQYARRVHLAIRRVLDRDERWDWRSETGGDALTEMVDRYGWPAYMWWGGPFNDVSHSGYLQSAAPRGPVRLHEPYTTYEYSPNRQHVIPAWHALMNPMLAERNDWQVNAPDDSSSGKADLDHWWPYEHYASPSPLYQLHDGQAVMLRRDSSIVVATAFDLLSEKLPHARATPFDAYLLTTDRPNALNVVQEIRGSVDSRLVLFGGIRAAPTILAVEIPPGANRPYGARTRFAIAPPPPLVAMDAGDAAISDPVMLVAPAGDADSPVETNAALRMMAASRRVPAARKIAVYWETYGFAPTDTVDIAVWIERYTPQGLLRRFGNALRVSTDLNTPVAITWREPQSGSRASVITGRVPVIGRSVVLDAAQLPKGSYWIDVAVARPGQTPVRSRQSVIVE